MTAVHSRLAFALGRVDIPLKDAAATGPTHLRRQTDMLGRLSQRKEPRRSGAVRVRFPISAFGTLRYHNPLAAREPSTDHILLSPYFPNAFAPAKDRWGKR